MNGLPDYKLLLIKSRVGYALQNPDMVGNAHPTKVLSTQLQNSALSTQHCFGDSPIYASVGFLALTPTVLG
jgi:hypothetical protein